MDNRAHNRKSTRRRRERRRERKEWGRGNGGMDDQMGVGRE